MSSTYRLTISTRWSGERADYDFSVKGRIEGLDNSLTIEDEIDGGQAGGAVNGGADHYRIHGETTAFKLDGQAMVLVDGVSMREQDMAGLGYAGPNPPQGYAGPGSAAWGGTGDTGTRGDAPVKDERPAHSDGGSGGDSSGVSASMDQRVELASGRDRPEDVHVFGPSKAREFSQLVGETPGFMSDNVRVALADGDYDVGVLDGTISSRGGAPLLRVTGNPEDPYSVCVEGPTNVGKVLKDEHLHLEGVEFSCRSQLWGVGQTLCRNVAFSDRNRKGHSSVGGKPVAARIQNSDVGHKDHPDRYAAYFYGTGECYFDNGTTLRATGPAYIRNNNTATVYVHSSCKFASGDKPIVAGRDVRPSDLGPGLNKIEPTKPENVF